MKTMRLINPTSPLASAQLAEPTTVLKGWRRVFFSTAVIATRVLFLGCAIFVFGAALCAAVEVYKMGWHLMFRIFS